MSEEENNRNWRFAKGFPEVETRKKKKKKVDFSILKHGEVIHKIHKKINHMKI